MSHVPTPSQTVGPFFSIGLSALCRPGIECVGEKGNRVTIRGRILDGDGEPVPDALLEIWQADDVSKKPYQGERTIERTETLPFGFGRIATNECGEFQFSTRKPAARRDEDGTIHAPHLVVLVLMRGLLRYLVTRIYFAGEAANKEDMVLKLVPAERRETLLAMPSPDSENHLRWDIHLQGERETVFFDV
jgi:protocatechuate 3,4-dioxygenase, alpha subunit